MATKQKRGRGRPVVYFGKGEIIAKKQKHNESGELKLVPDPLYEFTFRSRRIS